MAKKKSTSTRIERRELHDLVINFFNEHSDGTYNYKQVSAAVGAHTPKQRALITEVLQSLATDGFVTEERAGKYKAANRSMVVEGLFIRRGKGKNSVDTGDGTPIMVAERNSMHALNGDRVLVNIGAVRSGLEPEGEVIQIIERKEQVFVGTLDVQRYFARLITDSKFLATDIFIPLERLAGAETGDKVVARIVEWPQDADSPIGEVVDILGKAGENNAEIHAILAEFGLPYKYPENVERVARKMQPGITDEEVARRRDMRSITTFTIDPADAKDYDDALSIRQLDNGNWEIGVHIADVTHYVKPGTVIDREAQNRATSVYLVDRTVPMLPERLCNFICSLRPDEDKLTHSVIFEMDANAKVKHYEICHTVTRSNRRFSYEEAQQIIETGKGDLADQLLTLNDLAQKLRKERFENGAVSFEREEIKFDIDDNGKPLAVITHISKEANKLIEEFMLLANRTVAAHIGKVPPSRKAKAMVYRVHDEPDIEKLDNVAKVAAHFGYKIKTHGTPREVNRSINQMLEKAAGKPEEELLSLLSIRSMAKASYSTQNVGHYGLGFDYYTHFTSPIRRYPDMMVHRLLDRYAVKGSRSVNQEQLEEQCKHCSSQEQLASNAERASIKYKEVEFMGERLGNVYTGHISGVTEWGIYVEIDETHCEGMVPIRELDDDYYEFDEQNFLVRGRRTHRAYQLGDPVTIQVARANLINKQLDFVLVTPTSPAGTHRIDREPITPQNAGPLAKASRDERKRQKHEGATASRRTRQRRRGNSTRRELQNKRDGSTSRHGKRRRSKH